MGGDLVRWYLKTNVDEGHKIGFFQVGGGIAGDFPICAVPLIKQDLQRECDYWSYFAQISEATTSYGGYSGAPPTEKISWGKLTPESPMYMIESDATICFPLLANYVEKVNFPPLCQLCFAKMYFGRTLALSFWYRIKCI